jgi:hypothetical protein
VAINKGGTQIPIQTGNLKEGILGKFAINVKWKCYIIMDEN